MARLRGMERSADDDDGVRGVAGGVEWTLQQIDVFFGDD